MATKSVAYDHFEGIPDNRVGTYKAKCKHRNAKLSGHGKITSNLVTDLKVNCHMHIKIMDQSLIEDASMRVRKGSSQRCRRHSTANLNIFYPCSSSKKYAATDQRQKHITSKLIDYVTETLQPISTVEAPSFISMIEALNPQYQVPSRKQSIYLQSLQLT